MTLTPTFHVGNLTIRLTLIASYIIAALLPGVTAAVSPLSLIQHDRRFHRTAETTIERYKPS